MPRFFLLSFLAAAAVAFVAVPARAQRVDVYDWTAQPITNRAATVQDLPDGGCVLMTVCAVLPSTDGGSVISGCQGVNLQLRAGGGQGVCLAALDLAGRVWLNRQGVSSADSGVPDAGL